jgi:hypothetical protein
MKTGGGFMLKPHQNASKNSNEMMKEALHEHAIQNLTWNKINFGGLTQLVFFSLTTRQCGGLKLFLKINTLNKFTTSMASKNSQLIKPLRFFIHAYCSRQAAARRCGGEATPAL